MAIAAVIGRDLSGLAPLSRGLGALSEAGIEILAAHQTTRSVDVQFVLPRESRDAAIGALHAAFVQVRDTGQVPDRQAA